MDKINVLDKHTSELIAAGEVVERPASVVKELVENSIDAGATLIVAEIKNGGLSYIRITDNGCGMSENDAKTSFLRHATSKIHNKDDLQSINTMGFRGEALAAISAVSKIELFTKEKGAQNGTKISVEGGDILSISPAGCPDGTTIVVKDLFYNTPARLAFMKKDSTEASYIALILDKLALSNPHISIRFIKEGKEDLFTAGDNKQLSVIYSVYGRDFANGLLETKYSYNDITIKGYISKPLNVRPNRNMQVFFVNGRVIRSRLLMAALEQGYKNSIMTGKFPCCVLNIKVNLKKVDVNVHPSKQEIKFSNEKDIFDALYFTVKNVLENDLGRKEIQLKNVNPVLVTDTFKADEPINQNTQRLFNLLDNMKTDDNFSVKQNDEITSQVNSFKSQEYSNNTNVKVEIEDQPIIDFLVIGQAFNTYIIVQEGQSILFIDKHAGHERIIYEELKNNDNEANSQILLSPIVVNLPKDHCEFVMNNIGEFENLGFSLEDFGNGSIIIREVPLILPESEIEGAIMELAGIIKHNKGCINLKVKDEILHSVACKAAIKGGSLMSEFEQNSFVRMLLSMPDIKYCPHGRPIIVEMTRYQLEKMFKRS